jgi:hypothetical protein
MEIQMSGGRAALRKDVEADSESSVYRSIDRSIDRSIELVICNGSPTRICAESLSLFLSVDQSLSMLFCKSTLELHIDRSTRAWLAPCHASAGTRTGTSRYCSSTSFASQSSTMSARRGSSAPISGFCAQTKHRSRVHRGTREYSQKAAPQQQRADHRVLRANKPPEPQSPKRLEV